MIDPANGHAPEEWTDQKRRYHRDHPPSGAKRIAAFLSKESNSKHIASSIKYLSQGGQLSDQRLQEIWHWLIRQ